MEFEINKSYNFNTLAPSILGAEYHNMKVKGIVNATEAVKYADIVTKHEAVKQLITGLPEHVSDLTYILFTNPDNDIVVFAYQYIDPTTIVPVTTLNLRIEIFDVNSNMETIIRQRLKEIGVTNFTVTPFTV